MAEAELQDLLAQARDGDTAALGVLYDRYSPAIYRYLYRRCGDAALAEDLTGTTFLRMLEAIHQSQAWRQSFSGWLYRIAHNLLTDHLRARSRHPESELTETFTAGQRPDERLVSKLEAGAVRDALNRLKPEYAEILVLRFAEGLSHAQVAGQLGKTEGAVKVMQHRALKALRAQLALVGEVSS
jgi:RNA polymerase sigma-70 factor (ECF subfamily)